MKAASDVVACVYDSPYGMYVPVALKLAEHFKHVYYCTPCEEGWSTVERSVIGDGFASIERVRSLWDIKNKCDLFVFPDVENSTLQAELASQGFAIWGSRSGDIQEIDRLLFLKTLKQQGLPTPQYKTILGLNALREFLSDKEDKFIKISRYRGTMETWHWRSAKLDGYRLCSLGKKLGPLADRMQFLVIDAIDTPLEIGVDSYCINGKWPSVMLHGDEWKDRAYIAAVTRADSMPEQAIEVLDAFGPVLGNHGYRNFFSAEIRIKDGAGYFIDPTCRGGMPSSFSQLELWENIGEIIWAGANGELVEPKPAAMFTAECALTLQGDKNGWKTLEIPAEIARWTKISRCCMVDGVLGVPPNRQIDEEIGWLLAQGNTVEQVVKTMLRQAKQLPDSIFCDTAQLADLLREVHIGEQEGIEFTPQKLPEPAVAVEA